MIDLNAMCDALEATIIAYYVAQGAGVQVYSEEPGSVNSPAIIVEPSTIDYHAVMGGNGGSDTVLNVHALVAIGDRSAARRKVNEMISPDGPFSVVAAIHSDRSLGGGVRYADPLRAENKGAGEYGGATYLIATVEVAIHAL